MTYMKYFALATIFMFLQISAEQVILPPVLSQHHVADAKLYANRVELIADLNLPEGGVIAEVGVAFGDFSEVMINLLNPSTFVAFDTFILHTLDKVWNIPMKKFFSGKTHLEYFKERLAREDVQVITEEGLSWDCLAKYPDYTFDLIYIDAGHDYESVKRDIEVAKRKIKPNGLLVFNDYTLVEPYGVIQAVNELIVSENWKVVGFAFQQLTYCDIAITR